MRFIGMLISVIISILFCFILNIYSYSVLSNTEDKFSKLSSKINAYNKEAASGNSDNRSMEIDDILSPYSVKGHHYIYIHALPMKRSQRIKERSKRSRKKKKFKEKAVFSKYLMSNSSQDLMVQLFENKTFSSDFIAKKDDTQSERLMKRMFKMLEKIKENTNGDVINNKNELSPTQRKKKMISQVNGSIFSIQFHPKTKTFNLVNGQATINKDNSKFGHFIKTDNIEKSKNNVFIPKSVLDPEKVNSTFTLILTYVKPKNPFFKNKPEFKSLFKAKYVFWRIPKEYRYHNASFHLLLEDKKPDSWKEVRIKDMDEIYEDLIQFDITGDIPDKTKTLKGKLIMKSNGKMYESDIFKMKDDPKKFARNIRYRKRKIQEI